MKKTLLVLLLLLIPALSFSQYPISGEKLSASQKFTKPFFAIDVLFGYSAPMFELTGNSIGDFYDLKNYATNSGYYGNLNFKFTLANFKTAQLKFYWAIGYSRFMGDETRSYNVTYLPAGWPETKYYTKINDTTGMSSIDIHHPSTALGIEYALFTDRNRTSVFTFGGDFALTGMWGKIYDKPSFKTSEQHNNLLEAIRFGFGINAGYNYRVVEWMGLGLGMRFQLSNLFGKTSESITEPGDIPFNDGKDYSINTNLDSRNVGFFGIYGGFTFYVGGKR